MGIKAEKFKFFLSGTCYPKLWEVNPLSKQMVSKWMVRTKVTATTPEVKKNLHWSMVRKTLRIGKNLSETRCWEQFWFVLKSVRGLERRVTQPRIILQFLPSFKLGNSSPSTWNATKLLYKYQHFFSLKTD